MGVGTMGNEATGGTLISASVSTLGFTAMTSVFDDGNGAKSAGSFFITIGRGAGLSLAGFLILTGAGLTGSGFGGIGWGMEIGAGLRAFISSISSIKGFFTACRWILGIVIASKMCKSIEHKIAQVMLEIFKLVCGKVVVKNADSLQISGKAKIIQQG